MTGQPAPSEAGERVWPLGAYAPGDYFCRCISCGVQFRGDKRALDCLECAVRSLKKQLALPSYAEGVEASARVARKYAFGEKQPDASWYTGDHCAQYIEDEILALLAAPSPATAGREEMVALLRECRGLITDTEPYNEDNFAVQQRIIAKIDATLCGDGR